MSRSIEVEPEDCEISTELKLPSGSIVIATLAMTLVLVWVPTL